MPCQLLHRNIMFFRLLTVTMQVQHLMVSQWIVTIEDNNYMSRVKYAGIIIVMLNLLLLYYEDDRPTTSYDSVAISNNLF